MTVKYPTTDASGVGSRNESRIAELAKDTDDKLSVIGKCKNLLNPTLQTTTHDGITCTNNGDGTYTLNGTCSVNSKKTTIVLTSKSMKIDEDVKFICCTQSGSSDTFRASVDYDDDTYSVDYGEGTLLSKGKTITKISIIVSNGATVNNLVFKPMLTTNLSATYDDFVPYTGDGETLNGDVAALKTYVDKMAGDGVDFSTSTSKTLNDTVEAPLVLNNATRNFLRNTVKTQTQNGVTCTNNGDGTYTLNGTATSNATFIFANADYTLATFKEHSSLKLVK